MEAKQSQPCPSSQLPRRWAALLSLRRLCWISLFLLHIGPLRTISAEIAAEAQAFFTPATLFRLLSLSVWSAFFILKIVDVPWLRLKPGWRSRLTAVLIVCLLHVGVVERIVAGEADLSPAKLGFMLTATAAWQANAIQRRFGRWFASRRSLEGAEATPQSCRVSARLDRIRTPRLHFLPAFARLRAPPCAV